MGLKVLNEVLEVFLLLSDDLVFPRPEGLQAVALNSLLQLILLVLLNGIANHFDVGSSGSVLAAETEVLNSCETGIEVLIPGYKHLLDVLNCLGCEEVLLEDYIALVAALLGASDELLDEGSHLLGLFEGRGDPLVGEEVGSEVAEHCLAMVGVTAELANVLLVSHY